MQIEGGAYARELDRRAQKGPPQAAALRRVVVGGAGRVDVARRTVHAAVVPEHGRQHRAVFDELAVLEEFLVGHGERIAGPDVERKVDIPAEYLRQRERRLIVRPRGGDGFEERAVDDAACRAHVSSREDS